MIVHSEVPTIPSALALNPDARLYMLSWLSADLVCGIPITADRWREIYEAAADYQMVTEIRAWLAKTELAQVTQ